MKRSNSFFVSFYVLFLENFLEVNISLKVVFYENNKLVVVIFDYTYTALYLHICCPTLYPVTGNISEYIKVYITGVRIFASTAGIDKSYES